MTTLSSQRGPELGDSPLDRAMDAEVEGPAPSDDEIRILANPDLVEAEAVSETVVDAEELPAAPLPLRLWRTLCSALEWLFGLACLLVGLAVLASIPIVQFLTLGYLLEASGRVSRSGKLRDGFIAIRGAARIGGFIVGAWLWLLPLRLAADYWYDAWLIDPASKVTRGWQIGFIVMAAAIFLHILWAWLRGGKLRHFVWPAPLRLVKALPKMGTLLSEKADELWDFVAAMRIPYYFWLGVRGFAGALIWLFVPTLILIAAPRLENPGLGVLMGLFGGTAMALVLLYLPFLQAHFAVENRFRAFFEWQRVRRMFRHAPLAFWCALFITLLFALPLYLFKIEIIPREALWLPGLVFVSFMYPARLLTGWSLGLARRREAPRHWFFRVMARLAAVPVVVFFTFILFMTQYISWYGAASLFEQHAFLMPVPFLGG
jgi:hypothetical protein